MARRVITQLISDLSGAEIPDGKGETIEFSYRGKMYSIDLTTKEATAFDRAMETYLANAAPAGQSRQPRSSRTRTSADSREIRAWAKNNSIAVPDRGRIPTAVVEQYRAAN